MWASKDKAVGVGLSKTVGAHITAPCALDVRDGDRKLYFTFWVSAIF
jgi:hypothetical protein